MNGSSVDERAVWKSHVFTTRKSWPLFKSKKIAQVVHAWIQSKNSLVKHFEDMRLYRPSKEYMPVWFDPPRDGSMSCLTTKGMHTIGAGLSVEQPSPSPAPTGEIPNESLPDSSSAQPSEVPYEQQPDPSPRPSPRPSPQPSPTPIVPDSIPVYCKDQKKELLKIHRCTKSLYPNKEEVSKRESSVLRNPLRSTEEKVEGTEGYIEGTDDQTIEKLLLMPLKLHSNTQFNDIGDD
ncbi:hypothetical protein Tco_0741365 [Tanacetum coccineum]